MKIVEVTCRYRDQAYNVRHGGQSASSTSSSETAVYRLAEKLWGKQVKTITLLGHGDDLYSDRWRIEVDEPTQPPGTPTSALASVAAVLCLLVLSACGGSDEAGLQLADEQATCPADPATFVGPLPPQCLLAAADARKTVLPLQCANETECRQ